MAKRYLYTLADGRTFKSGDSFGRAFKQALAELGLSEKTHMRMGPFSVTTALTWNRKETGMFARFYEDDGDDGSILPGSEFWETHVRDRIGQICHCVSIFYGKPAAAELLAAMQRELAGYEAVEGCLNCRFGGFTGCPVCFEATGLGCPHDAVCDACTYHATEPVNAPRKA